MRKFIDCIKCFFTEPVVVDLLCIVIPALFFVLVAMFTGCSTLKEVPVQTVEKIEYRDSLVYRDSIVYIPQEKIVEIVPQLDTLSMDIEVASSKAYLDTANMVLKGELKSKKKEVVKYQTIIEYRERIDTVYIKELEPYEVIKTEYKYNNLFWISIIFNIIVILCLAMRLYLKFKGV